MPVLIDDFFFMKPLHLDQTWLLTLLDLIHFDYSFVNLVMTLVELVGNCSTYLAFALFKYIVIVTTTT